jgi:hypothetical protein
MKTLLSASHDLYMVIVYLGVCAKLFEVSIHIEQLAYRMFAHMRAFNDINTENFK